MVSLQRSNCRRSCKALGGLALLAICANGEMAEPADTSRVDARGTVADTDRESNKSGLVEEVRVVGERVEHLSWDERREIYDQLARGRSLYSKRDYKRAFPYLLNTAEHGFKDAQARVGYIYLRGLGEVPRSSTAAIGWLGVASSGNSDPRIKNYFGDLWGRVPDTHVQYLEEVVEEYVSKFGEEVTGVSCELRRRLGSHLKRLTCFFDQDLSEEQFQMLERMQSQSTQVEPIGQVPVVEIPPWAVIPETPEN